MFIRKRLVVIGLLICILERTDMPGTEKAGNPLHHFANRLRRKNAPTNLERLAKTVKSVGEIFLFVGATSYVLGVIIVSLYLGIFNAPMMSLLKINYVLTGMLALVPLLLVAIFICSIIYLWYLGKPIKQKQWKWFVFIIRSVVVTVGYLYVFWWRLGRYLFKDIGLGEFGLDTCVATLVAAFLVFIILLGQLAEKFSRKNKAWLVPFAKFCTLLCVPAIPFYIYHFSLDVYSKIPFQFGGAKYVPVQIFIDPNSEINNSFGRCKLTKDKDKENSGVWKGYLVFSTDTEYLFCRESTDTDANEVVCIKKEDVKAIKSQITSPCKKSNER